ncbi:MAG: hypothetical protein ABIP21_11265, partial [Acidimicrobiia bacterium]
EALGTRRVDVTDVALLAPNGASGIELLSGRAARAGEVVISPPVADWLHLEVGDTLALSRPAFKARVVGIGRSRGDFEHELVNAPGFPFSVVKAPGVVRDAYVLTYPPNTSASASERLSGVAGVAGFEIARPDELLKAQGIETGTVFFWSWVAAALILAMVGVIIAAAFATTARRQLVMLGQLSANGADPRFLRQALTLQGTIAGVVGTIVGMGGAAVGLAVARGFIVTLMRHDPGSFQFSVRDLSVLGATAVVAATVAARVPSRQVVRVPVLSALAGRRPLAPVPPLRWLKAVAIFGVGVGILTLVAVNVRGSRIGQPGLVAMIAIVGGLLVLAGAALLTPVAVTFVSRAGRFFGAAPRIALRGLVRVRSRSAAVVTAIAIAGALAVAGSTALLGLAVDRNAVHVPRLPSNTILIGSPSAFTGRVGGVTNDLILGEAAVRRIVPGARFRAVRGFAVGRDGSPQPVDALQSDAAATVVVADEAVVRLMRLQPADRRRLRNGQALTTIGGGAGSLTIETPSGRQVLSVKSIGAASWLNTLGPLPILMDAKQARLLGLETETLGAIGTALHALSADERSRLLSNAVDVYEPSPTAASVVSQPFLLEVADPSDRPGLRNPVTARRWSIVAMIAFALLISMTALLLGASESRDEKTVLDVLGARPATDRRIGAIKNWVIASVGALIAVPVGFIPIAVVFIVVQERRFTSLSVDFAANSQYPLIRFPIVTAISVVVLIPLVAAFGAWVASVIAQRAHAFRGTLAFDAD